MIERTNSIFCTAIIIYEFLHLSRGFDSLPQAEVEDEDNQNKADGELPARKTQVIDTFTLMNVQHPSSGRGKRARKMTVLI